MNKRGYSKLQICTGISLVATGGVLWEIYSSALSNLKIGLFLAFIIVGLIFVLFGVLTR